MEIMNIYPPIPADGKCRICHKNDLSGSCDANGWKANPDGLCRYCHEEVVREYLNQAIP